MSRYRSVLFAWVAAAAALALVLWPLSVAHAADPVKIRVEVKDAGFNGNPGDFTIEVDQGSLVELTFVWNHVGYVQEEHVMVLEGYRLEWPKIDFQSREATLSFVADKPGTFDFKCDSDCEVHDYLQRGHLKVGRGGGGAAAAALTPAVLTITPSKWATGGEAVSFMALLVAPTGAPIPKAEVRFFLDAEFLGTKGKMEIGTVKTDENGVAFFDYRPTLATPQQTITGRFEGMGTHGEAEQSVVILETGSPPSAYDQAPVGLEIFRQSAPLALALAVIAVWLILAYVFLQAIGISRVELGGERSRASRSDG